MIMWLELMAQKLFPMSPWFQSRVVSGPESKGFFVVDFFVINLDENYF